MPNDSPISLSITDATILIGLLTSARSYARDTLEASLSSKSTKQYAIEDIANCNRLQRELRTQMERLEGKVTND